MKKWIKFELSIVVFAIVVFLITSCKDKIVTNNPEAIVTLEAPIIQKKNKRAMVNYEKVMPF